MKIVYLTNNFPFKDKHFNNGVHSSLLNLVAGLSKRVTSIFIISVQNYNINEDYDLYCNTHVRFYSLNLNNIKNDLMSIKIAISKISPDIIHFYTGGLFLLLRFFLGKYNFVFTFHGIYKEEIPYKSGLMQFRYLLFHYLTLLVCPENIIHVSKYSYNYFSLDRKKFKQTIIGNSFNPVFKIVQGNNKIVRNNITCAFIGGTKRIKNIDLLIRAVKKMSEKGFNLKVIVFGKKYEDEYSNYVKKLIYELNLISSFIFIDEVSQEKLAGRLNEVNVYVSTSLQENLPVTILEMMIGSVFVIAPDVGGISELISNGRGLLYPKGSLDGLVSCFEKLSQINMNQYLEKAHDFAKENYSLEVISSKTIIFYNEIISND